MANKTKLPMDCTQKRRVLQRHELFDLRTGEITPDESRPPSWVVKACGVPLFSDEERERGTCKGCASGWTHPENTPVPADAPTLYG